MAKQSSARSKAASYPEPSSAAVSAVMRANRKTNTKPELAVRRLLHASGLRYRVNYPIVIDKTRIRPDVVFQRKKVAVFIDGCFWHGCPAHGTRPRSNSAYWLPKLAGNKERDIRADALLRDIGWTVIRRWEHEPPEMIAQDIIAAVKRP